MVWDVRSAREGYSMNRQPVGLVHDGCRLARRIFAAGIEVFNEPLSATEPGVIAHTLYHLSLHAMGPPASMASLTQAQLFLLTAVHYRRDDTPVLTSRKVAAWTRARCIGLFALPGSG